MICISPQLKARDMFNVVASEFQFQQIQIGHYLNKKNSVLSWLG